MSKRTPAEMAKFVAGRTTGETAKQTLERVGHSVRRLDDTMNPRVGLGQPTNQNLKNRAKLGETFKKLEPMRKRRLAVEKANRAAKEAAETRKNVTDRRSTSRGSRRAPGSSADTPERRATSRSQNVQRNTALDKARSQGRIQPRPPGHPNYQGAGPRVPKNTVAKSLTKGKGVRDLANSFSWRAGDLFRKASQTGVGKALTKFAGSSAGRVAAKVGAKVAGRVLVPLGIATDVVAVVGAGTEGVRALKAQHDARKEKAGSEAKYGTVDAATRTRHANDRKRERAKRKNNANLKTGYKLP